MAPSSTVGCNVYYSRRDLFSIRRMPGRRPSPAIICEIVRADLLRYRGTRAGALTRRRKSHAFAYQHSTDTPGSIDVVLSVVYSCRVSIESSRDRILVNPVSSADVRTINVGVLYAQSIGNKSVAMLDCIVENSVDIFAVVESWHDSADTPSVFASTPPDYQVFERARPRTTRDAASIRSNHGGIWVFVRPGIIVSTPDFPQFESFELLSLFVRVNSLSFVFVVIYRPSPASAVNDRFFILRRVHHRR